jgi:hypothetical protein
MFKRRLAVLGAVCALALTGLAGSALADEPPSTAGAKVTCTTSDGKIIELSAVVPGERMGVLVGPDGKVKKVDPGERIESHAAQKLPDGAEPPAEVPDVEPPAEVKEGTVLPTEVKEGAVALGVPGIPAEGAKGHFKVGVKPSEDGTAKTVSITCKKSE